MKERIYSLSAIITGYILIETCDQKMQNLLGNWLMLVSQILCTNAFYLNVVDGHPNPSNEDASDMLEKLEDAIHNAREKINE